jgi:hypothetical protein
VMVTAHQERSDRQGRVCPKRRIPNWMLSGFSFAMVLQFLRLANRFSYLTCCGGLLGLGIVLKCVRLR